jgi:hypothetical protein
VIVLVSFLISVRISVRVSYGVSLMRELVLVIISVLALKVGNWQSSICVCVLVRVCV